MKSKLSKFMPTKGHLFIARDLGIDVRTRAEEGDHIGVITRMKTKSYTDYIYQCSGSDNNLIVAKVVYPEYYREQGNRWIFDKRDTVFDSVGPEVIEALGLKDIAYEYAVPTKDGVAASDSAVAGSTVFTAAADFIKNLRRK